MSLALDAFREDGYRLGDLQALRYNRNAEPFYDGYLGKLYDLCKSSKRRSGDGILTTLFGGNPESTFDSIVSYLASKPLVVMGKWDNGEFVEAGFAFPLIMCGAKSPELAAFAGYGFFSRFWGTEDLSIMAMLGLSYMFNEFGLKAIHGTRYEDNTLTARFMRQFGFKDVGRIPNYQLRGGKLVPAVVTTLEKKDFEEYADRRLVELYRAERTIQLDPIVGSAQHPAVEESRDTVDAQVVRLAARAIPVVFFPRDSAYLPPVPHGIDVLLLHSGPGAGTYYYDSEKVTQEEINWNAAHGTHGTLLGHVQNKTDLLPDSNVCMLQAIGPGGVVIQDSLVERTAEAVAIQTEVLKTRFPDCEVVVSNPSDVLNNRVASREKKGDDPPQLSLAWM